MTPDISSSEITDVIQFEFLDTFSSVRAQASELLVYPPPRQFRFIPPRNKLFTAYVGDIIFVNADPIPWYLLISFIGLCASYVTVSYTYTKALRRSVTVT